MLKYISFSKNFSAGLLQIRRCSHQCPPETPSSNECPSTLPYPPEASPCNQYPPFYSCPRTKYDVNFIYINDKPPSTVLKDFVDRTAQTLFWTELIRGNLRIMSLLV